MRDFQAERELADAALLAVAEVLRRHRFITFFHAAEDGEDSPAGWAFDLVDHQGRRSTVVRDGPLELIKAVAGLEPRKQCSSCLQEKLLCHFSKNRSTKDGYLYRCKICERERVGEYLRAKRARKQAAQVPAVEQVPAQPAAAVAEAQLTQAG